MTTFHFQNIHALRRFQWTPSSVCALTGANGSGKSTVLLLLKTLRAAFERGLPEAVSHVLGGAFNLKNHEAPPDEPMVMGVDDETLRWRVLLTPRGASVDHLTEESLHDGQEEVFRRDSLGNYSYRSKRVEPSALATERLGLRWFSESYSEDKALARMAAIVRGVHVFYDPDIRGLREQGSSATDDRGVQTRGRNVLTMMSRWLGRQQTDIVRYQFVVDGLRAAFPGTFRNLELEAAGNTISARFFRPGDETPSPISHEANGLIAMLIHLAGVAAADAGDLVAIDEPEHALHPFAIRELVRRTRAWSRQRQLTVVLTTHSPVLLDELAGEPERVFVLERGVDPAPARLDELRDPAWLARFTLGELYMNGEFASNV